MGRRNSSCSRQGRMRMKMSKPLAGSTNSWSKIKVLCKRLGRPQRWIRVSAWALAPELGQLKPVPKRRRAGTEKRKNQHFKIKFKGANVVLSFKYVFVMYSAWRKNKSATIRFNLICFNNGGNCLLKSFLEEFLSTLHNNNNKSFNKN